MKINRRQFSTAFDVTVGLSGLAPMSVKVMDPVEEHIIPVYQNVASATVLLSSAYVSENPLAAARAADKLRPIFSKDEPQMVGF